jgi:3-hydroxyisobutyryl-CoA hydrolase
VTGVTHVLVDKKGAPKDGKAAERAAWSPNTLSELSQQKMRDTFFSDANSDKNARLPPPPQGSTAYTSYPHAAYALPSEQLIGRVIKGDVKDSGSFAMTRDEVYKWFEGEWAGKIGVREKVTEVMDRRTTRQQDGTLKWKSSS